MYEVKEGTTPKKITKKAWKAVELDFYKGLSEKKRNAKYYNRFIALAELMYEQHKAWINAKIESIYAAQEAGKDVTFGAAFNGYHDRAEELETLIEDFERKERTRTFTAGDWNTWSLMMQNID